MIKKVIESFENNIVPVTKILCEPMLSKRNLYPTLGGSLKQIESKNKSFDEEKIDLDLLLNILFYSDGKTSIEYIALKSGISENDIFIYSKHLVKLKLLQEND